MDIKTPILIAAIAGIHMVLLFAGFFAPYDPTTQNRELVYAPPTRLHFSDGTGFHLRPFIYARTPANGPVDSHSEAYSEDINHQYRVQLFTHGSSYRLLGIAQADFHLFGVRGPGKLFLLGTDGYGRDEFSRILYGGQISVAAGITATAVSLLVGTVLGLVAGYYGGWADDSLMGITELFLSLPWLYCLLGVRAFLPLHLSTLHTFFLLTGVIGLIGWSRPARLVRGVVLSLRHRDYVLSARGFGASDLYLMRRHIFPDVAVLVLTQASLLIPRNIAAEVTLSFFGLGVNEPVASWGNMLSTLQQYSVLISYGWLLAPVAALVVTSVLYSSLADLLQSRLKS
jgi:peptide/nickel transport system permease protein